ncbi:Outer membrane scaffolding protein for murein synthesis, MipA/OmpV family [Mariprofundus aestuarium]|uniref:Outer membrane scaffolding protein for murein synthesis, MipA/OmpV family n=1 Tax=Mariprofundus aestuarium TaxID=1921086 RepID=A0A2K8L2L3_MARES|nr:MipA/OmpV family protein [Mariprofundus aestuarium]ATX78476.1 Outer membrane scaffolding protein for murein synthesis, MipA/OmpV family [Mariprofundus aestuarium]
MKRSMIAILLPGLLLPANAATATESSGKPLWEVGIAAGVASLPHYMGSNERYLFGAPIPYLIYRGNRLKIDRSGIRRELLGFKDLNLDLSLGFGLPVRNSNRARAGMPDLKFSFQLGPRLNWRLLEDEQTKLTLRLPWRGVINTSGSWLGWVSEPDLLLEHQASEIMKVTLAAGLLYGSQGFHNTYYGVAPVYATAARPAYRAGAGLHSLSLTTSLRYQYSDSISLFSAIRYRNLSPGVIVNSPLVKDKNYISATIGMAWSFWSSEARAESN